MAHHEINDWRAHFNVSVHARAELLQMLSTGELRELAASIETRGLLSKIEFWVDADGNEWLLDGRNRLAALTALGWELSICRASLT